MLKLRKGLSLLFRGSHIEYGPWYGTEERQSRPATLTVCWWHPWQLWMRFTYKGKKEEYIYGPDQGQN
jgi:hypothetical protein